MKSLLRMLGLLVIIAGMMSLVYAAFNHFGYYRVLDGSPELYSRLHHRAVLFALIGAGLTAGGIVFIVMSKRM